MQAHLHAHLRLAGNVLTDRALGVQYRLTPDAAWLVRQLRRQPHVEQLAVYVAGQQGISYAAARRAVYSLLAQLEQYGGVVVHAPPPSGWWVRGWLAWRWRVRYAASKSGFLRSMLRAYGLAIAAGTLLFAAGGVVLANEMAGIWVWLPAAVLGSCIAHEAGHALAARSRGVPHVILARPAYAAILYPRPGAGTGRWIAAGGPLGAVVYCLAVASWAEALAVWCLCAACIHAWNVLPYTADGKTIWGKGYATTRKTAASNPGAG